MTVDLATDRGVFSAGGIDAGTKLLLAEARPPARPSGELLDLGCGYGPIAITLARRWPQSTVWAVDVNERALELTAENVRANNLGDRVRVCLPDDVPPDTTFAGIWSNPPIRVGKEALHVLLDHWLPRMSRSDEGRAWLVVNKHLGSDSLAAWLRERGWGVERLSSRMGYRILEVFYT
jgi:16S rRNA (guanine1207-N2)-methyltransferase